MSETTSDPFNLNGQAVAADLARVAAENRALTARLAEAEAGWASYAAEQGRHEETARARDAHYEARNMLAAKVDHLEARLAEAEGALARVERALMMGGQTAQIRWAAAVRELPRAALVSPAEPGEGGE